jgi:hypothetical protein
VSASQFHSRPRWCANIRQHCRPAIAMFIIHGAYHFRPKPVAFRDDYCLSCQSPRRSIAIRTFDVGHIFWIPILPVGRWKHWKCSTCGNDPHVNPKTRRSFLWAGLLCLIAVSLGLWAAPDLEPRVTAWILRIAAPSAAIWLLMYLLRTPKGPSLRERLAAIPAAADAICPFCATPLICGSGTRWSCPACSAVRY